MTGDAPIRCYIFDLDGTMFDCSHRLHHIEESPKDWRAFFAATSGDSPIAHIIEMAHALSKTADLVFVSGRSDECRAATCEQLRAHRLSGPLYMRKTGDHRDDNIIKGELLDLVIADGYAPIMAFEDRTRVVNMWRARGIPCAQVAPGDF